MAKLPRTTQKIFGKNAPENQITTFGSIKAGTPVYTQSASQIMNSAFEGGWSEAVEDDYAPYRQDRNAVDTAITQQLGYLFQDGIPEWDAGTTYYKGSVVKVANGNALTFYKSIADNNTASVNTTSNWHKMLDINASNQIVSPTINTPTISGGSMSNGTFANPTFSGTVNVPLASQSSSTDSTIAASIGWVNNPSLSSNVVHKTSDETIGGQKTFLSGIKTTTSGLNFSAVVSSLTKGTAPSASIQTVLGLYDKDGNSSWLNTLGRVSLTYNTNGDVVSSLTAFKPELNSSTNASISITYPESGSAYTAAPTPATGDNSTKIATTAFVKAQGYALNGDVVKLTGDQSVGGTKTFTNDIFIGKINPKTFLDNTEYTKGTAPSGNVDSGVVWRDSDNNWIGQLRYRINSNQQSIMSLCAYKQTTDSQAFSILETRFNANGEYYANFTSTSGESGDVNLSLTKSTTSTADTTIPCMGWVNSRISSVMGNVSVNSATNLTSSISLGSRYTFANSGFFVLTIQVSGQTNSTVTIHMSDTNNASSTSQIIGRFLHNGGTAERNDTPFSFPVKKGQSIYLEKTGGGDASITYAYLFPWNFS